MQYCNSVLAALCGGINLIDTSLNYRHQQSERAVGAGIRAFLGQRFGERDSILVCTKGGFLIPGGGETLRYAEEVAGDIHCMAPTFLADQIKRSRNNLGLEVIDVYYIHNPEVQLAFVERSVFMTRIYRAFEYMETAIAGGLIRYYGTATWSGYRTGDLSLRSLVHVAHEIAGEDHHFRFVQLPFNLVMQEAFERTADDGKSVLQVARELGLTVIASATLEHARNLRATSRCSPDRRITLHTSAQLAIQFVRSTPGITAALVGMRSVAHVTENLSVARVSPLYGADDVFTVTTADRQQSRRP